jgi:hypothetical protein
MSHPSYLFQKTHVRYNYNQYPNNGNQTPTDLSSFAQSQAGNGMPQLPDIPAGDFTWDQSQLGSYDPSATATFMSLMNGGGGGTTSTGSTPAADEPASGIGAAAGPSTDILGGMMEQKKWGPQGGAPMFNTPNCMSSSSFRSGFTPILAALLLTSVLLPWFPTAEERSLILHYCANAADLMMAIPSGLNPMLAINLPLALDSPRGMSPVLFYIYRANNQE